MTKNPDNPAPSVLEEGHETVISIFRMGAAGSFSDRRRVLGAIFRENQGQLVRFLTSRLGSASEAQDVAQETYLRLLQQSTTRPDSNLRALMYVTARNIAIDRRRQQVRNRINDDKLLRESEPAPSPERLVGAQQELELLAALIDQLPPKCRDAFVAYKFYEMSYHEIANRMGLTESMIRKYVLRAIAYCSGHLDVERGA